MTFAKLRIQPVFGSATSMTLLTFGADEIFGSFALVEKFLRRHSQKLDYARQLIALIFSGQ